MHTLLIEDGKTEKNIAVYCLYFIFQGFHMLSLMIPDH